MAQKNGAVKLNKLYFCSIFDQPSRTEETSLSKEPFELPPNVEIKKAADQFRGKMFDMIFMKELTGSSMSLEELSLNSLDTMYKQHLQTSQVITKANIEESNNNRKGQQETAELKNRRVAWKDKKNRYAAFEDPELIISSVSLDCGRSLANYLIELPDQVAHQRPSKAEHQRVTIIDNLVSCWLCKQENIKFPFRMRRLKSNALSPCNTGMIPRLMKLQTAMLT